MLNAAILGTGSTHLGFVITASPNTFYNCIPAARQFDLHSVDALGHPPSIIVLGAPRCYVNMRQAARMFDPVACGANLTFPLSPNVFIGN